MTIDELREELRYTDDPEERASLLVDLADRLYAVGQCQAAIDPASEALKIASRRKDRALRARTLLLLGDVRRTLGAYREAEASERTGLDLYRELGDAHGEATALLQLAMTRYRVADYRTALELLVESAEACAGRDSAELRARILMVEGRVYGTLGDPRRALELLLAALDTLEASAAADGRDAAGIRATLLVNIGKTYFDADDHDEAERHWTLALSAARDSGDRYLEAMTITNLARLKMMRDDAPAALDLFEQGLLIARELKDTAQEIHTLGGIGRLHAARGDTAEAVRYLTASRDAAAERGESMSQVVETAALGSLLVQSGDIDNGIQALYESLALCESIEARSHAWDIHREISAALELRGDIARAFEHFKQYAAIKEDVMGKEQQRAIATLRMRHEIEAALKDRELTKRENDRMQSELTSMALHLVQKNETLDRLRDEVVRMVDAATADTQPLLKKLVPLIQQSIGTEQEWMAFEQQFVQVHPEFNAALLAVAPDLSPTEQRVAALLRIQLNTKDIALIMSVTTRAVEKHRLKLRRKLGLADGVALPTYLATLRTP